MIREIVGFNFHRGVMACGRRKLTARLEDVITSSGLPCRLVVCPAANDAENLGGIIRSSAALGVDALLIPDRSIDPFSRRVLRVSMGTALKLPIVESANLLGDARRLREQFQVATFATVLADDAEPLTSVKPPSRWALFFGAEGEGLSPDWIAACARKITIPMQQGVDSLNVSVAAGIFLHHFCENPRPQAILPNAGRRL
jgi:tRNA G18 (ribose-2'-O)-methylase SpoU